MCQVSKTNKCESIIMTLPPQFSSPNNISTGEKRANICRETRCLFYFLGTLFDGIERRLLPVKEIHCRVSLYVPPARWPLHVLSTLQRGPHKKIPPSIPENSVIDTNLFFFSTSNSSLLNVASAEGELPLLFVATNKGLFTNDVIIGLLNKQPTPAHIKPFHLHWLKIEFELNFEFKLKFSGQ